MAATKENPIILYDIYSKDGPWSPNTYKTRLTLNYKRLPYKVEFVSLADVESKLKELGVPPTSFNPLFKYTLPMIADPSSDPSGKPTYVVESFEIALYLDQKYPAPKYPIAIPPGTRALQRIAVERVMNAAMGFAMVLLPIAATRTNFMDDKGYEYFNRTRKAIFGRELSELLPEVDTHWVKAREGWEALGDQLELGGKEGPFVMGSQISFIDFVLGGLLHGIQKCEGGEMKYWKDMSTWQNGRWATFWKEISRLEADSSEVSA
ncbi:Glutathione S-transferase, N-terminal domain [Rhizoctonia solani]|nr:Glutathione S-transferase, N-terminal domain [Rhizoctonia solani]